MRKPSETATEGAANKSKLREVRLSTDGKVKSFAKVPHLLQYKPTGQYYARLKVTGKLVRRKLRTNVYSKALLLLGDFLKEQRSKAPPSADAPVTFMHARRRFEQHLEVRHDLSPGKSLPARMYQGVAQNMAGGGFLETEQDHGRGVPRMG